MSCPLRVDLAGGLYHVTSRGDGRDDSYHFEPDGVYWLDVSRRVRLYDSAAGRGRYCVARPDPWLRALQDLTLGFARRRYLAWWDAPDRDQPGLSVFEWAPKRWWTGVTTFAPEPENQEYIDLLRAGRRRWPK